MSTASDLGVIAEGIKTAPCAFCQSPAGGPHLLGGPAKKRTVSDKVINLLRYAADLLEAMPAEDQQLYVGWDMGEAVEVGGDRYPKIKEAARAILATENSDEHSTVPINSVGCLIRYVADMMEE